MVFIHTNSFSQAFISAVLDLESDEIISNSLELIESAYKNRDAAGGLTDAPTLSSTECVPDFNQDLSNDISVSCNGEPTCEACFEKSFEKLNFYRRQLARLRCIYNNTKSFKDAAVAFGDNTSGIHAMAGIAWQKQRATIMKTFEGTKKTYDNKSTELLSGLQTTLRELNTCMYIAGENNWYTKSGFIYFEFMQERYKRTD
ncbi:MAG TPA: hypothetical protein DCR35_01070 [Runella sp.]|nr:hypothetical protein [Runella sp.]HAO48002.1 hypothetical protein [Runella sp.]